MATAEGEQPRMSLQVDDCHLCLKMYTRCLGQKLCSLLWGFLNLTESQHVQ